MGFIESHKIKKHHKIHAIAWIFIEIPAKLIVGKHDFSYELSNSCHWFY